MIYEMAEYLGSVTLLERQCLEFRHGNSISVLTSKMYQSRYRLAIIEAT